MTLFYTTTAFELSTFPTNRRAHESGRGCAIDGQPFVICVHPIADCSSVSPPPPQMIGLIGNTFSNRSSIGTLLAQVAKFRSSPNVFFSNNSPIFKHDDPVRFTRKRCVVRC